MTLRCAFLTHYNRPWRDNDWQQLTSFVTNLLNQLSIRLKTLKQSIEDGFEKPVKLLNISTTKFTCFTF